LLWESPKGRRVSEKLNSALPEEDTDVKKRDAREGGAVETNARTRAALGFRAHSGWAAVVAIAGRPRSPRVVDRRRIELADPDNPASKQPYHAAQGLDLKKAEEAVRRSTEDAQRLARQGLRSVIDDLTASGHDVIGCGIVLASGRPAATLAATLASHALIHTAEGELFRDVLVRASDDHKLPVTGVREREIFTRGAAELAIPAGELERRVAELGRTIGPPWTQDQKYAALVAWMALATGPQP